jgi:glycerol-3-phosphate acyltransferase PlsY
MNELALVILAYLLGSIPTAVWVSRSKFQIDIRDYGSGNAGATNTFRVLGSKWGSLVMLIDMLKGLLAVKLAFLLPYYVENDFARTNFQIGLGLAAVVGHIFPIFAEFRGGKGVATLFGLVLGISPWSALGSVGVFLMVLFLTRFVSLSSILASLAFPIFILVIFNVDNETYRVFAIAVALLVILTHQKNITRLLRGSESKAPILKYRDRRRYRQ